MLSMVAVCVGCGGANSNVQSPKDSDNNESNSTAAKVPATPPKTHTKDSIALIKQRISDEEAILIDVREQDEWDLGHLKDAVLAPLSVLEEGAGDEGFDGLLGKLSKDKIIYCHCVSGGRVMPASRILHQQGYDVRPLKPGYDDLVEAGFEDVE